MEELSVALSLHTHLVISIVLQSFFGSVAKPETVKRILKECYGNPDAVTDELVRYQTMYQWS